MMPHVGNEDMDDISIDDPEARLLPRGSFLHRHRWMATHLIQSSISILQWFAYLNWDGRQYVIYQGDNGEYADFAYSEIQVSQWSPWIDTVEVEQVYPAGKEFSRASESNSAGQF